MGAELMLPKTEQRGALNPLPRRKERRPVVMERKSSLRGTGGSRCLCLHSESPEKGTPGSLVPPTAHWDEEVTTQGDREPRLIPALHCLNLAIRFSARVGFGPPPLLFSYLFPGLPETLLRVQVEPQEAKVQS